MTHETTRRDLIQVASLAAAAAGAAAATPAAAQAPARSAPILGGGGTPGSIFWTVETTAGKVQGIANGEVKEFKGVPMGRPPPAGTATCRPAARRPGRASASAS